MNEIIEKLRKRQDLSFEQSKFAFENIMTGKAKEEEIHDFLIASSSKGETAEEIAGGVYVLRDKATKVNVTDDTIDTCGTGGDGKKYFEYIHCCSPSVIKFWGKSSKAWK